MDWFGVKNNAFVKHWRSSASVFKWKARLHIEKRLVRASRGAFPHALLWRHPIPCTAEMPPLQLPKAKRRKCCNLARSYGEICLLSRSESNHDEDQGVTQQICNISSKFRGSKMEQTLVQQRRLGNHYDYRNPVIYGLEKLQFRSVFLMESVIRSMRQAREPLFL